MRTSGPVGRTAPAPGRSRPGLGPLVILSAVGVAGLSGGVAADTSGSRPVGVILGTLVLVVCGASWLTGRASLRTRVLAEAAARMRAQQTRRRTDRLVTVGQLAAGIAHEMGTPLAVIAERARLVASHGAGDPLMAEHAGSIERQTRRMGELIRQLLDFARLQRPSMASADLRVVVKQVVAQLGPTALPRGIDLVTDLPRTKVMVNVNALRIHRVLGNLITNAMQAMPEGGTVTIGLRVEKLAPPDRSGPAGSHACCWVEDHGVGISEDVISRIFEPFFTTRSLGEGSGLGLAVSHGIVQEHGGWIAVHSHAGQGSRFSVYLPSSGSECREVS